MWSAQAQAEGLTLRVADNKAGYFGVCHQPGQPKPYQAQMKRGGKKVNLGRFATGEEAALCVARSPEGQAAVAEAAAAAAAPPPAAPLTSEEVRQQAQAEALTLLVANNKTGYFSVYHYPGRSKPYQAQVWRSNMNVHLGSFATVEEAALCVARSPEGQAAAVERAAEAPPLTSEEALQQAQAEELTLRVTDSPTGYLGVHHKPSKHKPFQVRWQGRAPGLLRHRRGGGTVRRTVAGGAGGGGEGSSGGAACTATDERGGTAAGAGGGADAAGDREQDGLLRRDPHQARPAQALPGAGEPRWQEGGAGQFCHRRGGGAVHRAVAGGAGGGGGGSSGAVCTAADKRGGAAAGAGGGAGVARGRE
eukprot:scaffold16773_cov31-Phaeocystis_antarctica.AAC.1